MSDTREVYEQYKREMRKADLVPIGYTEWLEIEYRTWKIEYEATHYRMEQAHAKIERLATGLREIAGTFGGVHTHNNDWEEGYDAGSMAQSIRAQAALAEVGDT